MLHSFLFKFEVTPIISAASPQTMLPCHLKVVQDDVGCKKLFNES